MTRATFADRGTHMEKLNSGKHMRFWLLLAGFIGLVFIRNIVSLEFPVLLYLAYMCVCACLADRDELVALTVSCIPFTTVFQYRYALLVFIVIYVVKYPKESNRINPNAYIPLLLMMLWELLHGFGQSFDFVLYIQNFSEMIVCTFIISLPNKRFDYPFISRVLAVCVAFACTMVMIKQLQLVDYNFEELFLSGDYRFGGYGKNGESYIMNYNPNGIGILCNLAISGLLLRIYKGGINTVDILLIVAMMFYGFLTLSRSFVLCFALIVVLYAFFSSTNTVVTFKKILLIFLALLVAFFVVNYFVPYIFDNLVARFNEEDVTNGRAELIVEYNEYLFSSADRMLFGTGLQDKLSKVWAGGATHIANVPHNSLHEIMLVWGIPGILLFAVYVLNVVLSKKSERKAKVLNYLPLIYILVKSLSGQLLTSGSEMLAFVFIYVAICTNLNEKTNKTSCTGERYENKKRI